MSTLRKRRAHDRILPLVRYIIFPCFAISVVWHPSLNAFMPSDIMWAYALYLESLASLPQLFMFQREGQVFKYEHLL